jgi:hypothetical protein
MTYKEMYDLFMIMRSAVSVVRLALERKIIFSNMKAN